MLIRHDGDFALGHRPKRFGIGGFHFLYVQIFFLYVHSISQFDFCEQEANRMLDEQLPLAAYEYVMKASHAFNLLDARHAVSVTERQRFILRVRALARRVAETYFESRRALGFPLAEDEIRAYVEQELSRAS